ncbi:uncharacterized protein ARMOST_20858 [Armillaria ostoyae]|uniref:Uncharacterized protein n=1 Tax=Armillaria ostoyae TaxID=47428 RepID=A0A284S8G9_ARMOS|nr:uncharacterized protein ARMOST_20858 [Armillaria ostoyae]
MLTTTIKCKRVDALNSPSLAHALKLGFLSTVIRVPSTTPIWSTVHGTTRVSMGHDTNGCPLDLVGVDHLGYRTGPWKARRSLEIKLDADAEPAVSVVVSLDG